VGELEGSWGKGGAGREIIPDVAPTMRMGRWKAYSSIVMKLIIESWKIAR